MPSQNEPDCSAPRAANSTIRECTKQIGPSFLEGTECTVHCHPGFTLSGEGDHYTIQCLGGEWRKYQPCIRHLSSATQTSTLSFLSTEATSSSESPSYVPPSSTASATSHIALGVSVPIVVLLILVLVIILVRKFGYARECERLRKKTTQNALKGPPVSERNDTTHTDDPIQAPLATTTLNGLSDVYVDPSSPGSHITEDRSLLTYENRSPSPDMTDALTSDTPTHRRLSSLENISSFLDESTQEDGHCWPLENFRILRELESGATESFIVQHVTEGDFLVLNRIKPSSERMTLEVQREVEMLKTLRHPNIARYYGWYGETDGHVVIQTELCADSLRDWYSDNPPPRMRQQQLRILHHITSGLHYIHQNAYAHLDLKPENVFLSDDVAKLANFGTVRLAAESSTPRRAPRSEDPYASPDRDIYSDKVDIYSLGVIFAEMLNPREFQELVRTHLVTEEDVTGEDGSKFRRLADTWFNDIRQVCKLPLVQSMVRQKPEERPTAEDILHDTLFYELET